MPSDYKEQWNERYCQLSLDMFDLEYWELNPEQRAKLDAAIDGDMADWLANRIDASRDRAKYA